MRLSFAVNTNAGFFVSGALKIIERSDRAAEKRISKLAYFVMRDARQNIRTRKKKSKPWQGPTNWTGILRDRVRYEYQRYKRRAVIGPDKGKTSSQKITEKLEFGEGRQLPRPYMRPAWKRQLQKRAPDLLKNSITP